jgi:galactitol-specific phosphotransferase system IIB component
MDKPLSVIPLELLAGIEIRCACGTGVSPSLELSGAFRFKSVCSVCGASIEDGVLVFENFRAFLEAAHAFTAVETEASQIVSNPVKRSVALRIAEHHAPK